MANLLLVVPNTDLKASLDFVLGVEGHATTWQRSLDASPIPVAFDCTLLDQEGTGTSIMQAKTFCQAFYPVILLAERQDHPLSEFAFRTLVKPLLGATLSEAVRDALGRPMN